MPTLPILALALAAGIAIGSPGVAAPVAAIALLPAAQPARLAAFALLLGAFLAGAPDAGTIVEALPDGARLARLTGAVETGPDLPWEGSSSLTVKVLAVEGHPVSGRVRVYAPAGAPLPPPGTLVRCTGPLVRPREALNPGETSPRGALLESGVTHIMSLDVPENLEVLAAPHPASPPALLHRVRLATETSLRENAGPRAGALLSSLLLGRRDMLPEGVEEDFRRSGTVHVLAISGLHVALLCAALFTVLRLVPIPRPARSILVVGAAFAYAALTGLRPPAARAALGVAAFVGARLLRRKPQPIPVLALAAAVILVADPLALSTPGFQLSFAAVAGILLLSRPLAAGLFARHALLSRFTESRRGVWPFLRSRLARSVPVTLAATFATAPLLLCHFGTLSFVVVPANLVVIPLVSVLVPLGFVAVLTGLYAPAEILSEVVLAAVRAFAALPGAAVTLPPPPLAAAVAYGAVLLLAARRPRLGRRVVILLAAGLLAVAAIGPILRRSPEDARLTILSVGHGACAVLETPEGGVAVFDAGSLRPRLFARTILPYLRYRRIYFLDALFLSHDDADHVNAAGPLRRALPVREVFDPGRLARGDRVTIPGAAIDALWPPRGASLAGNAASTVLRLEAGPLRALFMGDIEGAGLDLLIESGELPAADILVLPHHGRADPAAGRLRAAARPIVLVGSAGPEDRFDRAFADALRTDHTGAITILPGPRVLTFRRATVP